MTAIAASNHKRGVLALGLVTITAYGSWFYGFGVLVESIVADTGWSTSALGFTFGAAQLMTGLGAFVGGRLLDRFGGIGPFGLQAVAGGGLMLAATYANAFWLFGPLYAVGAGVTGATGFYHVTTAAAARLRPDQPDKAIATLTIIGAFASPIVLPLAAWMADTSGWRPTMRMLSIAATVGAVVAARFAAATSTPDETGPSVRSIDSVKRALADPPIRRMLGVYFCVGTAYSAVLVYQVPVLVASGLTLGTAGAIGGARGFCQVFGRVGLGRAVARFTARRLLRTAYVVSAFGVVALWIGGLWFGLVYAVLAGITLGATSPLQAMYSRLHFDPADLGLLMGLQGATLGVSGAAGPIVGGIAHDITGSWTPTIVLGAAALCLGAWLLRPGDPE